MCTNESITIEIDMCFSLDFIGYIRSTYSTIFIQIQTNFFFDFSHKKILKINDSIQYIFPEFDLLTHHVSIDWIAVSLRTFFAGFYTQRKMIHFAHSRLFISTSFKKKNRFIFWLVSFSPFFNIRNKKNNKSQRK